MALKCCQRKKDRLYNFTARRAFYYDPHVKDSIPLRRASRLNHCLTCGKGGLAGTLP
jgi:hypothetical protein